MATFEESLKKLESIVEQLEHGDLPLDGSLKLFEEGVALSNSCRAELQQAEGKVEQLLKSRDPESREAPQKTAPFLPEE